MPLGCPNWGERRRRKRGSALSGRRSKQPRERPGDRKRAVAPVSPHCMRGYFLLRPVLGGYALAFGDSLLYGDPFSDSGFHAP